MPKTAPKPKPLAQSAEAAAKLAESTDRKPRLPASGESPEEWTARQERERKAAKPEKSDHDQLAEIQATYRKIAKLEEAIADLKGQAKAKREALATTNRELRYLLSGQRSLPFGKPGKPEKLDTTSPPAKTDPDAPVWFEVREVGSNRWIANLEAGDPQLADYRKRGRDFVVRQLAELPPEAKASVPKRAAGPAGLVK